MNEEDFVNDVFELDSLSIKEQIERLQTEIDKMAEPLLITSDLLERLRVAAEQGLLNVGEKEQLYKALVDYVSTDDSAWLGFNDENRTAIFNCLGDLPHTLPTIDDLIDDE